MSHFSVLVTGDNVDEQLAPFREFEQTGSDDRYVREISILAEVKEYYQRDVEDAREKMEKIEDFPDYLKDRNYGSVVKKGQSVDTSQEEFKYGWIVVDGNNRVVDVVKRTNPDAKWDYFEIGGLWRGFFPLKSGVATEGNGEGQPGVSDQCRKSEIDIAKARHNHVVTARKRWQKFSRAIRGETWTSWSELAQTPEFRQDPRACREYYLSQPPVARLKQLHSKDELWFDLDEFHGITKEEYLENAIREALATYAYVMDGQWHSHGEMGLWGLSIDHIPQREWNRRFCEMFDTLPDDTMLTLVDCHI